MSHEIEVILMRELAAHLVMPIFLVDAAGNLLFYNEPAEPILGSRFDETGSMGMDEWSTAFEPTDDDGRPVPPEELPLVRALREQRPAHARLSIRAMDGVARRVDVTALPLLGEGGRHLGAAAIFWEATS